MKPTTLAQFIATNYGYLPPVITVHMGIYLQSGGQMRHATTRGFAK